MGSRSVAVPHLPDLQRTCGIRTVSMPSPSPVRELWLLRLFGAHQDRPDPDPASWTLG
jgi:hypothetical protein